MPGDLSTAEVAKALGLDRVRIWQLIKSGKLEAYRIGRAWAIKPYDLQTYIAQRAAEKKA